MTLPTDPTVLAQYALILAALAFIFDALIFLWLVGTWFYEGHHRRCTVLSKCPACGETTTEPCHSGKHE